MTVQDFFKKNLKWVAIVLLALFFIKSFQSCNRNMEIKKLTKESTYLVDSLNAEWEMEKQIWLLEKSNYLIMIDGAGDRIQELEYEVKLAESGKDAADRRANAVQSTAEKIRENTTIKIENKSKQDTVSVYNQ